MDSHKNIPSSLNIGCLNKMFFKKLRKLCNDKGINSTYAQIIMILAHEKDIDVTQNYLCQKVNLAKPTISLTLKNMESLNLITRTSDLNDSRKIIVKLTEEGFKLDNEIRDCFKEAERQMIEGIPEEDLNSLKLTISKMINNLREDEK